MLGLQGDELKTFLSSSPLVESAMRIARRATIINMSSNVLGDLFGDVLVNPYFAQTGVTGATYYLAYLGGKVKPLIAQRLPLEEARRAHEMLGEGGVAGKIVLLPNG
jgi:hypothetical protein